jgi:hypothetical protein
VHNTHGKNNSKKVTGCGYLVIFFDMSMSGIALPGFERRGSLDVGIWGVGQGA